MSLGLSNPSIEVNDVVISIVPNSYASKRGVGDMNIRAQSAGGNSIETVVTENAESKISMVKFSIISTADNLALLDSWLSTSRNGIGNTIRASENNTDLVEAYSGMVIVTEPDRPRGADAQIDIEFKGNAAF